MPHPAQTLRENKRRYILCVDDEPAVLNALFTQLSERFGQSHEIESVESGEEALRLFDAICRENGRLELVLCDQIMPGLLGQYVLEHIHQRDPRTMKILLTGQAGFDAVSYSINHAGLHKYIEKPWKRYDLLLTVENLLKQYSLSEEIAISHTRYEMILQSMNNGLISLDFQGQIISFNQAAADILGFKAEEVLGKTYFEVFFRNPGNEEMNDLVLQAINEELTGSYQELDFLKTDRQSVPLGLMTSILKDSDDKDVGVLMVFHDLSEIRRYSSLKDMFSRYVAKQVVEKISSLDEHVMLRGEKRDITVLFSDIRGFTTMTEQLEPTEVVSILNSYFSCMIDVIYQHEGTLDKFLGDGVMCLFGAPIDQPDHPLRAARTALAMKQALNIFNRAQRQQGKRVLEVGIGINSGAAVVGNVGSEKRLEYTAIGDNVNLAARLQSIALGGQILISESTFQAIKSQARVKKLTPAKIKGKARQVQIYELQGLEE
ncbi:MAG: PAS domain S-box protein [bacterium]|nr:PAS domain S-box protein [bacterium]